jgi:hypothetical protein
MKQSKELQDLMVRFYESMPKGEAIEFTEDYISRADGVLTIGSDPGEWYEGYEAILNWTKALADSLGQIKIEIKYIKAYSEGTMGWAVGGITMKMPDGTEGGLITTGVFQLENGNWKVVHFHHANGSVPG